MAPKKLFVSYSHADEGHLKTLRAHLKALERNGVIEPWFDGYMLAGDDFEIKIRDALESADFIALLVSPDFLASDYCFDVEMQHAVARHEAGTARVIPIIVRDCLWRDTPFGKLKAVPTDGKPIMSVRWPDKDEAWTLVAAAIGDAARAGSASKVVAPTRTTSAPAVAAPEKKSAAAMPLSVPRRFSDLDRDEYRHASFEEIAARFQASIGALGDGFSGVFRRVDANRFTAAIYEQGKKRASCTIWIGGGSLGKNSICYADVETSESNSMNEWLRLEDTDGQLLFQAGFGRSGDERLDANAAAEYLWARFVERLTWR